MDTQYQEMLAFFMDVFRCIPEFLMSKPTFYFVSIIFGYFVIGMLILVVHLWNKRR